MGQIRVDFRSYDELRQIGDEFLKEHHPELTCPIPIEEIVDVRQGINIVPMASLQHVCEVDAFINRTCTTIHVDVEVYASPNANRYRFSLAHEIAHMVLHKDVLESLSFNTMAEWKRVYAAIPKEQHDWIEWQAYSLGGLLLVPTKGNNILDSGRRTR